MASTPVGIVTQELSGLDNDLLTVGAVGLGIGVVLFALRKGVKVAYGFIR